MGLRPRRMVPPRCERDISGMYITTGSGVSAANSVELASVKSQSSTRDIHVDPQTLPSTDIARPFDDSNLET